MVPVIKVLIVDDSALIRQMLTRALALDPRVEVVGIARNGLEAIERCKELDPDVVTLDVEMPELSGLEALPFIIRDTKARVIMLSSLDDPDTTYEALSAGAIDFIAKPRNGFATSISDLSDELLQKIKTAFRVAPDKRAGHASGKLVSGLVAGTAPGRPRSLIGRRPKYAQQVVAVAASTGGPPALERVFSGLSADLPAAFMIVQHLPAGFTASLVMRLDRVTDICVREAAEGMHLEQGAAYVAPHGYHMTLSRGRGTPARIQLEEGPPVHGVRPSADPMIESVARTFKQAGVGVLLTGMGSDGAEGMSALSEKGGSTIVQDEESSVVWGMPGAAVKRGAAKHIVPLDAVAKHIRLAVLGGT